MAGFLINNTGITSMEHQYYEDSYLNNYNNGEDNSANSRAWNAAYGWMQFNQLDWWTNEYNCDNWFDPNQIMVKVANQIVQWYANPLNIMVAVFDEYVIIWITPSNTCMVTPCVNIANTYKVDAETLLLFVVPWWN